MSRTSTEQSRAYQRQWYQGVKEKRQKQIKERRDEIIMWFRDLRRTKVCESCGEEHPACLDFHHKETSNKTTEVTRMVVDGWSKERILSEIEKCTVLCSNCHRKLHFLTS